MKNIFKTKTLLIIIAKDGLGQIALELDYILKI